MKSKHHMKAVNMKHSTLATLVGIVSIAGVTSSCKGGDSAEPEAAPRPETNPGEPRTREASRIRIVVGDKTFAARLADNSTAAEFKAMLPLKLRMKDLHANEKFANLDTRLPTNDEAPGTLRTGDLMLWSARTVVLFYKAFPSSYRYTRLGWLDDPEGLAEAVGAGDATVEFSLPQGGGAAE